VCECKCEAYDGEEGGHGREPLVLDHGDHLGQVVIARTDEEQPATHALILQVMANNAYRT